MAVLTNIAISSHDLHTHFPATENLKFEDQHTFKDVLNWAKDQVYNEIKMQVQRKYESYTNAEIIALLAKVKDCVDGEPLKKKILTYAASLIYQQNGMYEDASYHESKAVGLPLLFHLDEDSDGVVDDGEKMNLPTIRVGR